MIRIPLSLGQNLSLSLSLAILSTGIAGSLSAQTDPRHWSTYVGANSTDERAHAVTSAANGDIVVAGYTHSSDFKTTSGAYQPKSAGLQDAFIVRLAADGKSVIAATHLGGKHHDVPSWVHVASDGTIWVGGTTLSPDFPVTANAFMKPVPPRSEASPRRTSCGRAAC